MTQKRAIGVTLPIKRTQSGYFSQSYSVKEQVKSNLTNLVLTEPGERIMQPDMGCRLHALLFEPATDSLPEKVRDVIEDAVSKWLPFVSLSDVEVTKDETAGIIYVIVNYFLTNSPNVTDSITVSF